jgi:hypothetical protein
VSSTEHTHDQDQDGRSSFNLPFEHRPTHGSQEDEQVLETRRKQERCWLSYWLVTLKKATGPTLLFPQRELTEDWSAYPEEPPNVLFLTFDRASHGENNETSMKSALSVRKDQTAKKSQRDILLLNHHDAALALGKHLKLFPGDTNFVSWTSSLIFAIQYAICREHKYKAGASDIKICATDATQYPPGQFVRDIWLL